MELVAVMTDKVIRDRAPILGASDAAFRESEEGESTNWDGSMQKWFDSSLIIGKGI
jgi:hypothetical protein